MATLRANGETLIRMTCSKVTSDGAEADEMRQEKTIHYAFMSSGYALKKTDSTIDLGTGTGPVKYPGTWKRHARIKAHLMDDKKALFESVRALADSLREKGWDAEIA
jgi:hypothetical protein